MEQQNEKFFGKTISSKKKKVITGIVLVIVFFWIIGSIGGSDKVAPTAISTPEQQLVKDNAQKELDELMELSKQAGLIKSYDFSEIADNLYRGEVYVDKVWYTQTVQFKKDFLAKVSILRKAITGYSHFEMRDAYTNEKVAEVTSFSKSLEVYK